MLSLIKELTVRNRQRKRAIVVDADLLMSDCGVDAHEEARRRKLDANDILSARYWGQVKSEIGRRSLQDCSPATIVEVLDVKTGGLHSTGYAIWDSASESRAEAYRLASAIEAAGSHQVEHPFAPPSKARHAAHPPFQAVLEFIETEAHEVRQLLSLENDGEPQSAG
jgi:hypothetical protein